MFYDVLMFFFIYGFIGWCIEVCYSAVERGKWSNRGFLNGAICPIYGVGAIVVLYLLEPISDFGPLLFVGGVALCSAIELITGYILEKIFHQRWWDYSSERFNIKGYVCLKFSLYWGFAVLFVAKLVHPTIQRFVDWIPYEVGVVILVFALMVLALDMVDTFRTVIGINKELEAIHEAAAVIRKVSDGISERLFEGTIRAVEEKAELGQKIQENREELGQKLQENREGIGQMLQENREELGQKLQGSRAELELQMALGRAEFENKAADLKERAEAMARKLKRGQKRMLRAFPDMRSTRYEEDMVTFREIIEKVTAGRLNNAGRRK